MTGVATGGRAASTLRRRREGVAPVRPLGRRHAHAQGGLVRDDVPDVCSPEHTGKERGIVERCGGPCARSFAQSARNGTKDAKPATPKLSRHQTEHLVAAMGTLGAWAGPGVRSFAVGECRRDRSRRPRSGLNQAVPSARHVPAASAALSARPDGCPPTGVTDTGTCPGGCAPRNRRGSSAARWPKARSLPARAGRRCW